MIRQRGFVLLPVVLAMTLVAMIAYSLNHENGVNAALHSSQADMDRARYAAEAGLQAVNNRVQSRNCNNYPSAADSSFGGGAYSAYATPTSGSPVTLVSTGTFNGSNVTLTRSSVYAYKSSTESYILQPNATAGIDTYLVTNSSTNYGNANTMLVNSNNAMLIKFDLSAFPAGSIPKSLSLYVRSQGSGALSAKLYRMQTPWLESGANWATVDGTTTWGVAGGDFHSTLVAEDPWVYFENWVILDVTDLGFAWMSGRYPNNGARIFGTAAWFSSGYLVLSDNSDSSRRPGLYFQEYWLPCGTSGP